MLLANSLRQAVHTHRASVHQAVKLLAARVRVVRVTAGLVESNGSPPPGLWLMLPAGWLQRTGIISGTLPLVIKYELPLLFTPLFRPHQVHAVHRCSPLLQVYIAWSACRSTQCSFHLPRLWRQEFPFCPVSPPKWIGPLPIFPPLISRPLPFLPLEVGPRCGYGFWGGST